MHEYSFILVIIAGEPLFASCPEDVEICPSTIDMPSLEGDDVELDTRIKFVNGGLCNRTKRIRQLEIERCRDQERVYFCSNIGDSFNQLCPNESRFVVEQQQPCNGTDINLCKYDMKIVFLNFGLSDEGLYNVKVVFENDGRIRESLGLFYNLTLSPQSGKLLPIPVYTTFPCFQDSLSDISC